ncbi:sigma-70 family RNA polymerase sigma factor [Aeromicrobium endophyticum]|nr:sigma-70 family RNA polymerase sigma factor [Aeromicrobium endophyticum]
MLSAIDESSDAELISAVRDGDADAFGALFGRHRDAAERLARQLTRGTDVDDLVAESFTRMLVMLQSGRGPDEAFRAYLLTSIRRLHIDRIRARNKTWSTAHEAELDRVVEFIDPAEMTFEHGAAAVAFASLPERWRLVLWHLDVEGDRPADVAPLLGMTPNGVSALAYRAREGLRQAYLQGHLAPPLHEGCRRTAGMLGAYVRKSMSARDTAKVEAHLDDCSRCTGLLLELREVNANLSGVLGPAVLGAVFAGYVAAGAGLAALGAGTAAVLGAKTVAAGAAKLAVVPLKVVGGTLAGAGTQGVVAAAVVTGVATAGTVAVTTDFGRGPAARTVLAPAPSAPGTPTPVPDGGSPASAPTTNADAEPSAEPATTPSTPSAETPAAQPVPDASPSPSPSPDASPETAEIDEIDEPVDTDPSATPAPVETPVVPTDYGIEGLAVTDGDGLLQRRFTVPVVAATAGRAAAQPVTITVQLVRPVRLTDVVSTDWDCGSTPRDRAVTLLVCTTTPSPGQGATLVVAARGVRPEGTARLSSPGDPDAANDAVSFRAGAQLLLL